MTIKTRQLKRYGMPPLPQKKETQKLWNTAKEVLKGKTIAKQSYLKRQENHQIDKPNFT